MRRSETATRQPIGLRVLAEQRARELGYASVEAMLEAAYATDRPWTEVAAELGVCRVDSVSKWARRLGMLRGEGWYMEREQRDQRSSPPVGKAAFDPAPCRQPSRQELLTAAVQRAAQRVNTPAARRSLARCCQHIDPAAVVLCLTPEEEAEWAARHAGAWLEEASRQ